MRKIGILIGFQISTSDIQNKLNLDYYTKLVDVSEFFEWKRFVARKIDSIQNH